MLSTVHFVGPPRYVVTALSFTLLLLCVTSLPSCEMERDLSDYFPGLFVNISFLGANGVYNGPVGKLTSYNSTDTETINYVNPPVNPTTTRPVDRQKRESTCKSTLCCSCCRTEKKFAIPNTITFKGEQMIAAASVSALFQAISLGECRRDGGGSGNCAECQCAEEYRLSWILVVDPDVPWHPQVQFYPVLYPFECTCINPGN